MSSLERLERLFAPVYWFIMAVGYAHFFVCMLPGMAAAFLLGRCRGVVFLPKYVLKGSWQGPLGYRRFFRFYGWRWTLAAVAFDGAALALSVFLGGFSGWLIVYSQRGRFWGGLLAAACFLLGHFLPAGFHKNKEV